MQVSLGIVRAFGSIVIVGVFLMAIGFPQFTTALPFGGQASVVRPCYNDAIFAILGPPRGGYYVWTKSTRTYQFGPPRRAGQWILGLSGVNYFCILQIAPNQQVVSATYIMMMGSSQ